MILETALTINIYYFHQPPSLCKEITVAAYYLELWILILIEQTSNEQII